MKLQVTRQKIYSRPQLLLRGFFGFFYVFLPHGILILGHSLWGFCLRSAAFWTIVFTGVYPKRLFDYYIGLAYWRMRVEACLANLVDGYPAFGLYGFSRQVVLEAEYPVKLDRNLLAVRLLFGFFYIWLPHGICLFFRTLATAALIVAAWWVVLFTGAFPEKWHDFIVGTYRWNLRLKLYTALLSDQYPPFSGKE